MSPATSPLATKLSLAASAAFSLVFLSGCGEATHSLGGVPTEVTGSLGDCGDGVVAGSVVASRQTHIDALAGCREITGDLTLGFSEMDLRPLGNLRTVRGSLYIQPFTDRGPDGDLGAPESVSASSLAGLESLERVGGLTLDRVAVQDLSALRGLRDVALHADNDSEATDSWFVIEQCGQLRNLHGLENLGSWSTLMVGANPQLETLDGLAVPATVDAVWLSGNPVLRNVSALRPLKNVGTTFYLSGSAVEQLDGFEPYDIGKLSLEQNPNLADIEGLRATTVDSFHLEGHASLEALPSMTVLSTVRIVGNPGLRHVPPFAVVDADRPVLPGEPMRYGFDLFEVGDNPNLESVVLPGLPSSDVTVFGNRVEVYGNPLLTRLELNQLSVIFSLSIAGNASLQTVQMRSLRTVDELRVTDNPSLATQSFAQLATSSSTISGNLAAPAP